MTATRNGQFVKLPEGGRLEIELDPEQVEVYVRAAIDREARQRVERVMHRDVLYSLINNYAREWVHNTLGTYLAPKPDERPHDAFERAVARWLTSREGWVAKVLRRKTATAG